MEVIASQRAVQLSTVQSYIAEAMAAGYSYPWHRMRVPFSILASLYGHVRAYHKQQLLSDARLLHQQQGNASVMQDNQQHLAVPCKSRKGSEPQALPAAACHGSCVGTGEVHHGKQDQQQQQQQQYGLQHEPYKQLLPEQQSGCQQQRASSSVQQAAATMSHSQQAVVVDISNSPVHGTRRPCQAVCSHCGLLQDVDSARLKPDGRVCAWDGSSTCLAAAQVQSQQPVQLPDMQFVRELVLTSKGTKALRDTMDTLVLSYGHMRLAFAHIYCLLRQHVCSCQPEFVDS